MAVSRLHRRQAILYQSSFCSKLRKMTVKIQISPQRGNPYLRKEEKAEEARQVVDIFFQENTEHTHDLIVFHGEVMNDEPYAVMA
jgi:hypothetical protein